MDNQLQGIDEPYEPCTCSPGRAGRCEVAHSATGADSDRSVTHGKEGSAVVVNGRSRSLVEVGGHVTLLDWLRADGLTGSKEGCAEGECGACAVLVVRPDGDRSRWTAINACLVPAAGFDGQEIVTAEGLGRPGDLHPVQREMADRGGSQCGYCTPGFICSMAVGVLPSGSAAGQRSTHPIKPTEHGPNGFDLHALSGNLCRCTGYRPIRDAAYALGRSRGRTTR